MVCVEEQVFFLLLCNSSPTCRGRRILAIYYVKRNISPILQQEYSYYHKNKNFSEIKSHHYIISFDPKDREECGLTGERAQQLGLNFAKKNFPGHQALVCTHTDGHNESGNIHVHIVINSLRKYDVPQEPYMKFDCESKAGYKHHLSTAYLAHLKHDVMDMCQKEGLHQVDLLSPAERKIQWK